MTTKANVPLLQRMLSALRSGDAALIKRTADAAEEEVEAEKKKAQDEESEAERKETKDALAGIAKTVDALVATVAALAKTRDSAPAGEQSSAEKVDSAGNPIGDEEPDEEEKKKTADAMADMVTRAEILVPGFKVPTADSVRGLAGVAVVQRKILAGADKTVVSPLLAGRTVDALTAPEVATVFLAASELARAQNNNRGAVRSVTTSDHGTKAIPTAAEINARNAAFWAKQ